MTPAQRKESTPRAVFFAGKAAPGCMSWKIVSRSVLILRPDYIAKLCIRLIVNVSKVINEDPDTKQYLTLHFLPCVTYLRKDGE